MITEKEILEVKRRYTRQYVSDFRKRHPRRYATQQVMSRVRAAARLGMSEEEILNSAKTAIKQVTESELVEMR